MSHDIKEFSSTYYLTRLGPQLVRLNVPQRFWDRILNTFRRSSEWPAGSWQEYASIADVRVQEMARRFVPSIPKPQQLPESEKQPWTPCAHYGGDRECDLCRRPVPTLRRAQQMYEQYRKFVLQRIHVELLDYFDGRAYIHFDDLEQECWRNIAAQIDNYVDGGTPMAWLKVVVHGTVVDHFRHNFREKRDVRKEAALKEASAANWADDHNAAYNFARPTRPEGAGPDRDGDLKGAALQAGLRRPSK